MINELKKVSMIKELKKDIEYNFDLDVFLDPWNHMWIDYNDFRFNIIVFDSGQYYLSVISKEHFINENFVCDDSMVILYYLLKHCKAVHKWGDFKNLN
jgi:hypothetical protein